MEIRQVMPWWFRIGAKLVLARLPFGYPLWRRLNVFRHGEMLHQDYANEVLQRHIQGARIALRDAVLLELGPGDSVLSGVLARLGGAARTYLVDAGAFASTDVERYRQIALACLARYDGDEPSITPSRWRSFADVLDDCRIEYGTQGRASLRQVPDAEVDLSFSQAVLEHVRRLEFAETMRELRRVARPGGFSTHQVDLRDHLGGALNNLRMAPSRWEHDFFTRSGFYTNRLRCREILDAADEAGFSLLRVEPRLWDELPTPKARMHPTFRHWSDEELRIMDFFVVLQAGEGRAPEAYAEGRTVHARPADR